MSVLLGAMLLGAPPAPAEPAPAALRHDAYIWQRAWNRSVREAIATRSRELNALVVLSAEVSWTRKQPRLFRVPPDYATLRSNVPGVGLALRIGEFPGPFAATGEPIDSLIGLAAGLVREAKASQLLVRELQIDFDCAESKLSGYRTWVEAIRRRLQPVPVTITALPAWLGQPAFEALARSTDGYVLQVHSLERPGHRGDPMTLCDPEMARRAVERAGRIGIPFRVALPTYGYHVAFDRDGKFRGLSAEGPSRGWPADAQVLEVRSDPQEIAGLVRGWSRHRPASMTGLIWYRLPIQGDALNWPWETLAAVMRGTALQERSAVRASSRQAGLVDLILTNEGNLEVTAPARVIVRWQEGPLISADALQGYDLEPTRRSRTLELRRERPAWRLAPGETRPIGWLRLSKQQEVQIEVPTPD